MSLYWMYLGDQATRQQAAQSVVNQSAFTSKMGTDVAAQSNQMFTNKLLHPSTFTALQPNMMDLKYNWAFLPFFTEKPDTSKHFHIFVGDLCPNLDLQQMYDAFSPFGPISDCKIIQDPQTLKSKGYGFVTFVKKDDAEKAIKSMNGQFVGSRAVRTNWAIRKGSSHHDGGRPFTYEDILCQSGSSNCTVYCGGIMTDLTEEAVRKAFVPFGEIAEIRIFKEKGYAFIRFNNKEDAARAIVDLHLTEVCGHVVKCSWGKKSEDTQKESSNMIPSLITPFPQAAALPQALRPQSTFAFLNQPQQCFGGGLTFNPASAAAGSTQYSPLDYYLCPPPAANMATIDVFQKSLECSPNNATFHQQFVTPPPFSHIPSISQQLLPNLNTAALLQQQQQQQMQQPTAAFQPQLLYTLQ